MSLVAFGKEGKQIVLPWLRMGSHSLAGFGAGTSGEGDGLLANCTDER